MMKRCATALALAVMTLALVSCSEVAQADSQVVPVVEAGQTYRVLVGNEAMNFKVLELGKSGLVKVQAAEDGNKHGIGIKNGEVWWLNLNRALLIEAK